MKKNQFIAWITAGVMCLSAVITAYPAKTAEAMTIIETDVPTASEGCTILGVYGSYYSQAQEALDRLNEIRKEACEAGNVPDPRNPSRTLAAEDYVPIKWSTDLESVAKIRAVEGGLSYGFFGSGHNRLNGKTIWSVNYNGISSSAEDLAYNWGTSMVSGINQWYGEKEAWVNQVSEAVTGHYTSMIDPKYTYVGLGDFYTEEAQYPNTLAGQFSSTSNALDQTMQDAPTDVMQKIEVQDSYIKGYVFEGATTVDTDESITLTLRAELLNGSNSLKLWAVDSLEYTSSDTSVATVTSDGVVSGHKSGKTVITVKSDGSVLASTTITVNCSHEKELLSSTDPTCTVEGLEVYYCETCGGRVEQIIPKLEHDYVYGEKDSEGYTTGICSMCQDSIRFIQPTTCQVYWKNSTSDSSYYFTTFPTSNPIDSVIYCWIQGVDGDKEYQEIIIKSADESVISVPETVVLGDAYNNQLRVLAPGITIITIYPKYNPNPTLKKTFTVRVGDAGSVDIADADVTLSQETYAYTGSACKPNVSVSYHNVPLNAGTDYTVSYENNTEIGTATVIVTGTGIFSGTTQKNFTITGLGTGTPEPGTTGSPKPGTGSTTPGTTGSPEPGMGTPEPGTTGSPESGTGTPGTGSTTPGTGSTTPGTGTPEPGMGSATPGTGSTTPGTGSTTPGTGSTTPGTGTPEPGTGTPEPEIPGIEMPEPDVPETEIPGSDTTDLTIGTTCIIGSYRYKITGASTVSMIGAKSNNITTVKVPQRVQIGGKTYTVTAIGNKAFKKNKKITAVTIGDNVKTIGTSAFEGCTKMTEITLGKGVTKIGNSAFKNCKKLKTIVVKSTKLKKVGKNALKGTKINAKVKVPAKKLSKYKKLFKNKGQGKKMKIVKS